MVTRDHNYRNAGNRRMGNANRAGALPTLITQRGTALAPAEKEAQASGRQRGRLGRLIADLSASFVGLPVNCIDTAIEEGLHHLVATLGVDHAAFYQSKEDGLDITHSWPIEIFEAPSVAMQERDLNRLATSLRRQGVVVIEEPAICSDEISKQVFLLRPGLKSAVLVGVMNGQALLGALMLSASGRDLAWIGDLEEQLRMLGAVFGLAIARKQAEEALRERDRLSRAMLDSLENHVVVVDESGRVIAVSEGRGSGVEMFAAMPTVVSVGVNYLDACREACEGGFEPARAMLAGVEAIVGGSGEMIEIECEWLSPFGQKFLKVSITPLIDCGAGAVISYRDTTRHKMAEARLREVSGKIIKAVEEERRRIARDLHDDLSQTLALTGLEVEQIKQLIPSNRGDVQRRLSELWKRNQETSLEVRRLSHQLHPSQLEYLGLVAAVNSFCKQISEHHGIRIRFEHFDVPTSIPRDKALCMYRVVQESLRNVVKHSGSGKAQVVISCSAGEIKLCISDEGAGFDPDSNKTKAGIGLIGMRERLLLVGGEISIDSQPSLGTTISARVPL